ncbi:MAG: OmpA family protein [Bacteroidetes bacterium]|nr:OmpA family protein [Bacteroidota bacterium]
MRFFTLVLMLLGMNAYAQLQTQSFTVYFQSNSAELDLAAQATLDSLNQHCASAGYYQIELHAHTDQQGNTRFNQQLSVKRENSVENYLLAKGLFPESISASAHGESMPVLQREGEENIRENRRVNLLLHYQIFKGVDEVLSYTDIQKEQQFSFADKGPQAITGEKGTQLLLPSGAFQLADGTPVENDQVAFVLQEFPGMGHGITHQLTTLADGKLLESGGMFRIEATYKGQELSLRKGKEIKVQLPSDNVQKGMSVFVGEKDAKGDVVWKKTEKEFKAIDTTEKPKMPLIGMGDQVRSYITEVPAAKGYTALEWDLKIPKFPQEPRKPRMPSLPVKPQQPEGEAPFMAAWFNRVWKSYYQQETQYRKALVQYEKRMDSYERGLERYKLYYARYQRDSAQFVVDSIAWSQTLTLMMEDRVQTYVEWRAKYDANRWNGALISMAKKMDDSLYYSSFLIQDIRRMANYYYMDASYNTLRYIERDIDLITFLESEYFMENPSLASRNGKVSPETYLRNKKYKRIIKLYPLNQIPELYALQRGNQFANAFENEISLSTSWKAMEKVVREKKEELGIFDRSDAFNVYQTSLNRMGYINCDRFYDVDPKMMARLDVNVPPSSKVFVVIPRINSLIPLYSGHDTTGVVSLPVGEEIKIVSVGTYEGKATFSYRRFKVSSAGNHIHLDPKLVSIQTLNKQLAAL